MRQRERESEKRDTHPQASRKIEKQTDGQSNIRDSVRKRSERKEFFCSSMLASKIRTYWFLALEVKWFLLFISGRHAQLYG